MSKWSQLSPDDAPEDFYFYHGPDKPKRNRRVDPSTRPFIAWDGEGVNLKGEGKPQSYVLFGCSEGSIENVKGLSTFDCLDFILSIGEAHPNAVHCGFAFSYDSNMIVHSLAQATLARLHKFGYVRLTRKDGSRYTITFTRGKFFRVTKYRPEYDWKHNSNAKTTVQIFDIFSFFACSFIKAYEDMIGPVPDVITLGKRGRDSFRIEEMDEIRKYWTLEIQMLRELAEELRQRVLSAGMNISQWYGPGALATYAMRQHSIKQHMKQSDDDIRKAARHGYAGGRFELYLLGRTTGPIYSIDINSAYPNAIRMLPSMSEGNWSKVEQPDKLARFGIYHVRMQTGRGFETVPSPVFHRDSKHNISYPWMVDGWYWTPEAVHARHAGAEIVEGYEYRGASTMPFTYVEQMYEQRKQWKEAGISAQIALKLCLNSTYGKLAQRVGYKAEDGRLPPFHQLEWAGWITSYTRAMLYDVIRRCPPGSVIAVETDGIYTTYDPALLGITHSKELGGWEVTTYDEILYVQSGLAWLRKGDQWTNKKRGLDGCKSGHQPELCDCPGIFSLNAARSYLQSLHPKPNGKHPWQSFVGSTTRFVGLGQALSAKRFHDNHCLWLHQEREINPANQGKRVHLSFNCTACRDGLSAYESAHTLTINSKGYTEPYSYPHDIPWESSEGNPEWLEWRQYEDGFEQEV